MLIDLFEHIESFFKRLESYTEVKPSEEMTDMMVKIVVEVLSVLAIVTAEIKQGRRSQFITSNFWILTKRFSLEKFLKKLLGRNDVEDALKRLDKLTQEEARMAMAEMLKITRGVDGNLKVLMDGAQCEFLVIHAVLIVHITRWQRRETFVISNLATSFSRALLTATGKQMRRDLYSWLSPRIPLHITIFLVTLTTREQLLGFSKVASIKSGGRVLHSCGYMENVRSLHCLQLNNSQTCIFKRVPVKASFGS